MRFFENIKLKFLVKEFDRGFLKCDQCRRRNELAGQNSLSMVQCGKCGYGNFIPMKVGGFWLYEPLGGGGMGSVYKGFNAEIGELCAVKILSRDGSEEFIKDLEREAGILRTLGNHPNIVRIVTSGCDGDEPYCAMEFLRGTLLSHVIEEEHEVPEWQVLGIILDLLAAEKHIYSKGYLFSDMKPQNIMIRDNGKAVLFDFGLCVPVEVAANPPPGDLIDGSPLYLPPERMLKHSEGQWSEIYSIGMVAYHALTGKPFFKSDVPIAKLAKKHATGLRISIAPAMMPQCSPEMVGMLDRMIKKEPAERIQTFEELEIEVRRILGK